MGLSYGPRTSRNRAILAATPTMLRDQSTSRAQAGQFPVLVPLEGGGGRDYPMKMYAVRKTKPLTASVAWTPISSPVNRLLRRRRIRIPLPATAASAISTAAIAPNEAVPVSSPCSGPPNVASNRQPKPPRARNPCSPESSQGGAAAPSVRRCRTASVEPKAKAVPRRRNEAISTSDLTYN